MDELMENILFFLIFVAFTTPLGLALYFAITRGV